ncbi:hypothetical protein SPRG_16350 [Saprolegnia parasitica CBS 223.65]|uniref:Uncharacterized protein n=1 Tax=Saprolegnia parasitica (strain CBS 223.65) TaxID=695850 RepID=A0A067BIX9_SAPPC|nr:hypothetical protein SPRG_16350 [Saprolegnia parasitica CBS 223.65]KDO18143.1 hypothetical protein SPRG_16350 [Saprolegnia parasitica CBS 223.65]|eukprot:XP_012211144.1 hypothetical protein SPRG_16350 [Saprolegnia parasitica CBS 223.65]
MSTTADVLRLDDAPVTSRPLTSSGRKAAAKAKSEFRRYFDQEELPLTIENTVMGDRQVVWTTPLEALDYQHFLPICFSGLQETLEPYPTFAYRACMDLLEHGMGDTRVLRALAALMPHVKSALGTRDKEVVHRTLLVLQQLAVCQGVGEALSEYYRSILPLCNLLKDKHLGTGDSMTKALIQETLEILEGYGKDDAYHQIQQHVPAFQHSNNIK